MGADASEVHGLAADLRMSGVKLTPQARAVVHKTAMAIKAEAQRFAPVDTGALRSSISVTTKGLSGEVGPTVAYAPYVEFGTRRMAPAAFMGPAADRILPDFVAAMEQLGGEVL